MNKLIAGIVLGLASAAATANPLAELMENTYGGFAVGLSSYPGYCDNGSISCGNAENPAWKFYSGFHMSSSVAGEIGYLNFERARADYLTPNGLTTVLTGKAMRASGFNFNLAFTRELSSNWSAIGRIGIARMKTVGVTYSAGVASSAGPTEMHTEPYIGAALSLDMSDLIGKFLPQPIDRFKLQMAVDMTRIEFGSYKRYARLWSIGGGLEF
jgi:opacity protein-like surface antigen